MEGIVFEILDVFVDEPFVDLLCNKFIVDFVFEIVLVGVFILLLNKLAFDLLVISFLSLCGVFCSFDILLLNVNDLPGVFGLVFDTLYLGLKLDLTGVVALLCLVAGFSFILLAILIHNEDTPFAKVIDVDIKDKCNLEFFSSVVN